MKCKITYKTKGGDGQVITDEIKVNAVIETLKQTGCFDIAFEFIYEDDPCDNCKKNCCADCPYSN